MTKPQPASATPAAYGCLHCTTAVEELAHYAHGRGMKRGAIDHDEIGLPKAHPGRFAAICNPVAQARLLNDRKVDLVAQVGLCVGHDLVPQEECDAPVTTLVVKDRALDHHTVAALRFLPADADRYTSPHLST